MEKKSNKKSLRTEEQKLQDKLAGKKCNLKNIDEEKRFVSKKQRQQAFLKLCEPLCCNVQEICKQLCFSQMTFYDWMKRDPDFAEKYNDIKQTQVTWVESKLFKKIEEGDTKAIMFYLKCKGNYQEKQVIDLTSQQTVTTNTLKIEFVDENENSEDL